MQSLHGKHAPSWQAAFLGNLPAASNLRAALYDSRMSWRLPAVRLRMRPEPSHPAAAAIALSLVVLISGLQRGEAERAQKRQSVHRI